MSDDALSEKTTVATSGFGALPDGTPVERYTLANDAMRAELISFGARLISLRVPDRNGQVDEVALGFGTLEPYVADTRTFMGASIGRFANRIAAGQFTLGGKTYQLGRNDGPHALHGGLLGFDRLVWSGALIPDGVEFTLVSPDGDGGFPGALTIKVSYTLCGRALAIKYTATTDAPTVLNVTNHTYFNLAGERAATILDHLLRLPAGSFTPTDATLIPTGDLLQVEGTPFDFRAATRVGERIDSDNEQLLRAGGYDQNWVLGPAGEMKLAAVLSEPLTGRRLTVETTEPGVQFYSGNFLDGSLPNRAGGVYARRSGLCLETQHFPDSPNQPAFPSTVLEPGATFSSQTTYTFSVDSDRIDREADPGA